MSSLVYLGLSLILFCITFGIAFLLLPMIFGQFFQLIDNNIINLDPEWLSLYNQNKETVQYLIPIIPALGIFIIVLKVLMTASARGRD
jgi:hypothetical protein